MAQANHIRDASQLAFPVVNLAKRSGEVAVRTSSYSQGRQNLGRMSPVRTPECSFTIKCKSSANLGVRWLDTALAPIAKTPSSLLAEPAGASPTEPQPATSSVCRIQVRSGQLELCRCPKKTVHSVLRTQYCVLSCVTRRSGGCVTRPGAADYTLLRTE
jgi:hypothetical protein